MNEHCRGIVRRLFSELRYFLSERIIMSNAKMPNSTMSMEAKEQYGLEIRKLRRRKVFAQVMIVIGFVFFALLLFICSSIYIDHITSEYHGDGTVVVGAVSFFCRNMVAHHLAGHVDPHADLAQCGYQRRLDAHERI